MYYNKHNDNDDVMSGNDITITTQHNDNDDVMSGNDTVNTLVVYYL